MVANTYALQVLKHIPYRHPCVKGNHIGHLGILRLVKCVNDAASCFPLNRLECVPVGDAGTMHGFGFGEDHTGRTVGDRIFIYRQAVRMWERRTESIGVVDLVHYEANEVVFPPFFGKLDGIDELC